MHDFGKFCYLDLQKSGSSSVSSFLREHCALPAREKVKHGRIETREQLGEPGKLFFITVRDPLDQYKSLYFYGVSGQGRFRTTIVRELGDAGEAFYDGSEAGFGRWLDFVLDPANARVLGEDYARALPEMTGFLSHRYLMLSFYRPLQALRRIKRREQLVRLHRDKRLHARMLRTDRLNAELADLVATDLAPYMRDADAAVAALARGAARKNASPRKDRDAPFHVDAVQRRALAAREWLFFEELGFAPPA